MAVVVGFMHRKPQLTLCKLAWEWEGDPPGFHMVNDSHLGQGCMDIAEEALKQGVLRGTLALATWA